MSVTITTSFYEYDTPAWHDLAKVVYTSPNLDSPNTAGTRSHILPGELDLATWREDTSNMYRIFNEQAGSVGSSFPGNPSYPGNGEYVNDQYGTTSSGFHIYNSIKFELTAGESYDNRVTAWDDVTHSSTDGVLFDAAHIEGQIRASCVAYRYTVGAGTVDNPETIVEAEQPVYNFTMNGFSTFEGPSFYSGYYPFTPVDLIYAFPTTGHLGDVLICRPWLAEIDSSTPYGVHDFVITLHYSYT
jgi:hypothetical protein